MPLSVLQYRQPAAVYLHSRRRRPVRSLFKIVIVKSSVGLCSDFAWVPITVDYTYYILLVIILVVIYYYITHDTTYHRFVHGIYDKIKRARY